MTKPRRVGIVDTVRGIAVVYIVIFHGLYSLVYLFGQNIPWFHSTLNQHVLQPLSGATFIFLAGIASRYSASNLKRGTQVFLLGAGISIVSRLVDQPIRFGVLSLLGSCMLLYGLWHKFGPQWSRKKLVDSHFSAFVAVISILLFIFTYRIQDGVCGVFSYPLLTLPSVLYSTKVLYFLGFPHSSFVSYDYYPLIPWGFLFLAGLCVGVYFIENRMPDWMYQKRSNILTFIGQHSLIIYLLHQPVLIALFALYFKIMA